MEIRPEILPFLGVAFLISLLITLVVGRFSRLSWRRSTVLGGAFMLILGAYLAWFFRDPERIPPTEAGVIVAAADGVIARITRVPETSVLQTETVRVSTFLSLFDVHVNRAPMSGTSTFLGYYPGKRLFTFQEKSSEVNQHNTILLEAKHTRCLIKQIVGPVCRRVVYWLDHDNAQDVNVGDRIGMMKFGSRLDLYLPASDVTIEVKEGDRVRAGETVIARLKGE